MSANEARGEQEVNLGDLGTIQIRPTYDAICRIEASVGAVTSLAMRFVDGRHSMQDVVSVVREMMVVAPGSKRLEASTIGDAVMSQGMLSFSKPCIAALDSIFKSSEGVDSGNG